MRNHNGKAPKKWKNIVELIAEPPPPPPPLPPPTAHSQVNYSLVYPPLLSQPPPELIPQVRFPPSRPVYQPPRRDRRRGRFRRHHSYSMELQYESMDLSSRGVNRKEMRNLRNIELSHLPHVVANNYDERFNSMGNDGHVIERINMRGSMNGITVNSSKKLYNRKSGRVKNQERTKFVAPDNSRNTAWPSYPAASTTCEIVNYSTRDRNDYTSSVIVSAPPRRNGDPRLKIKTPDDLNYSTHMYDRNGTCEVIKPNTAITTTLSETNISLGRAESSVIMNKNIKPPDTFYGNGYTAIDLQIQTQGNNTSFETPCLNLSKKDNPTVDSDEIKKEIKEEELENWTACQKENVSQVSLCDILEHVLEVNSTSHTTVDSNVNVQQVESTNGNSSAIDSISDTPGPIAQCMNAPQSNFEKVGHTPFPEIKEEDNESPISGTITQCAMLKNDIRNLPSIQDVALGTENTTDLQNRYSNSENKSVSNTVQDISTKNNHMLSKIIDQRKCNKEMIESAATSSKNPTHGLTNEIQTTPSNLSVKKQQELLPDARKGNEVEKCEQPVLLLPVSFDMTNQVEKVRKTVISNHKSPTTQSMTMEVPTHLENGRRTNGNKYAVAQPRSSFDKKNEKQLIQETKKIAPIKISRSVIVSQVPTNENQVDTNSPRTLISKRSNEVSTFSLQVSETKEQSDNKLEISKEMNDGSKLLKKTRHRKRKAKKMNQQNSPIEKIEVTNLSHTTASGPGTHLRVSMSGNSVQDTTNPDIVEGTQVEGTQSSSAETEKLMLNWGTNPATYSRGEKRKSSTRQESTLIDIKGTSSVVESPACPENNIVCIDLNIQNTNGRHSNRSTKVKIRKMSITSISDTGTHLKRITRAARRISDTGGTTPESNNLKNKEVDSFEVKSDVNREVEGSTISEMRTIRMRLKNTEKVVSPSNVSEISNSKTSIGVLERLLTCGKKNDELHSTLNSTASSRETFIDSQQELMDEKSTSEINTSFEEDTLVVPSSSSKKRKSSNTHGKYKKNFKKKCQEENKSYEVDSDKNAAAASSSASPTTDAAQFLVPAPVSVVEDSSCNRISGSSVRHRRNKRINRINSNAKARMHKMNASKIGVQKSAIENEASIAPNEELDGKPWTCTFCGLPPHYQGEDGSDRGGLFGPTFIEKRVTVNGVRLGEPVSSLAKAMKAKHPGNSESDENQDKKSGMIEVWGHEKCLCWSSGIHLQGHTMVGADDAVTDAIETECSYCGDKGASIACNIKLCPSRSHYYCAIRSGWVLNDKTFKTFCGAH